MNRRLGASDLTLAPSTTVNSSGWTLLSGATPVSWTGTLTRATLYLETDAGTDSLYLDD